VIIADLSFPAAGNSVASRPSGSPNPEMCDRHHISHCSERVSMHQHASRCVQTNQEKHMLKKLALAAIAATILATTASAALAASKVEEPIYFKLAQGESS
jgi:hypothetical protein